ncbi:MAG: hypothetical protein ACFFD4_13170 [Candidatus Odinarchaeota archaeon]
MKGTKLVGYISMSLFIFLVIGNLFTSPLQMQATNRLVLPAEVTVLYDPVATTSVKAEKLFSELIDPHVTRLSKIAVDSEEAFLSRVNDLTATNQRVVMIGHGSWAGIQFGKDIVSWEDVRELFKDSQNSKIITLACYSSMVPLALPEDSRDKWFGLDGRVDYVVGSYAAAIEIARSLGSERLYNHFQQSVFEIEDYFFIRAATAPEPLWKQTSHNRVASLSLTYEVGSALWGQIDSTTRSYGDDPSRADDDDLGGLSDADIWDWLFQGPSYINLWLKHNYGKRLSIRLYAGIPGIAEITIIEFPLYYGTAPTAAQTAFDSAVSYYQSGSYVEAGTQLSYAVHYGQDMTMPFHVYDYARINYWVGFDPISIAISLALLINDLIPDTYALARHDTMEDWVYDKWYTSIGGSSLYTDVKASAASTSLSIGTGSTGVYDAVTSVAQWTRGQMARSTAEAFGGKSDSEKKTLSTPLLAKAVDYSTALYTLFIQKALVYHAGVLSSSYIHQVVYSATNILAQSTMQFTINKAGYYYVKVEYWYYRNGVLYGPTTDRWLKSYYSTGTHTVNDDLYNGRAGDLVFVRWSMYDSTGTIRIGTRTESYTLTC